MTAKIARAENLLWIVPILYGLISYFTAYSEVAMMYFDDAYFILSFPSVIGIIILILILPFLVHLTLRDINERNFFIAWTHVALTVTMVVALLFIYSYSLPINIKWRFYVGELPAYKKWMYYNTVAINIIQTFIYVQSIYVCYGVTLIVRHQLMQRRQDQYDYESETYEESADAVVSHMIA